MSVAVSWSEVPPAPSRPPLSVVVPPSAAPLARAVGSLRVAFKRRGALTVLDEFYQAGAAKARLPLVEPGDWPLAVVINTAGGLTGGDQLDLELRWGAGTAATVAGQAAEKVYRALAGQARVTTRLTLEAGAAGEWLPQETILFDRAGLARDTQVTMAGDARFLGVESLVLGRAARGETLRRGSLRDAWRIRRDGRLIFAEALALEGDIAKQLGRPAVAAGAGAVATLILVAPEAEALLSPLRAGLESAAGQAGASAWNGLLVARFLARTGEELRRDLTGALAILRGGKPLPRVWLC